ncbi:hypothetical protein JKP88DRAFT_254883 [Tribonema minus]|uniref:Uncharacterized protein n=1 Tax=Tribonema minus TaxID=303371 RepID=A0A835Z1L2_9STRA|nr:hypothetical protein JKP88DRAFT_254883 [Tribonema minus]
MNAPPVRPEELYMSMANALFDAAGVQPTDKDDAPASGTELALRPDPESHPSLPEAAPSVFYKDSRWFYKAPQRPVVLKCSSRVCCNGAPADYKCHSCVKFDAAGLGFCCSDCFVHCHPSYREDHRFVPIEQATCIEEDITAMTYRAELNENMGQLQSLLEQVRDLGAKLGSDGCTGDGNQGEDRPTPLLIEQESSHMPPAGYGGHEN